MVLRMRQESEFPEAIMLPDGESNWRSKYTAVLFENDLSLLPLRLQEAEQALLLRERILWATKDQSPERAAIGSALRALQAIRACAHLVDLSAHSKVQNRLGSQTG